MPTTSSTCCSTAGIRLNPTWRARSRARSTVSSAPMVTMSGRGTITSRTTVSPNSMIESIRARSSVSMTSPSNGHVGHRQQLGFGHVGTQVLALLADEQIGQADQGARHHADRPEPDDGRHQGGTEQGRPLGVETAQFLGTASPSTKMITISNTVAATTPRRRTSRRRRMPTRVATTSWQIRTINSTGLRKPWGFSVRRRRTLAPRRPSYDQRLGLGPTGPDQTGLGQGQQGRHPEQDHHHDQEDRVHAVERGGERQSDRGARRPTAHGRAGHVAGRVSESLPVSPRWPVSAGPGHEAGPVDKASSLLFTTLHPLRLGVDLVVHAEEVEDAVDDQQGDLVVEGDAVVDGVAGRHRRADHHIPQQDQSIGVLLDEAGPRTALVG